VNLSVLEEEVAVVLVVGEEAVVGLTTGMAVEMAAASTDVVVAEVVAEEVVALPAAQVTGSARARTVATITLPGGPTATGVMRPSRKGREVTMMADTGVAEDSGAEEVETGAAEVDSEVDGVDMTVGIEMEVDLCAAVTVDRGVVPTNPSVCCDPSHPTLSFVS